MEAVLMSEQSEGEANSYLQWVLEAVQTVFGENGLLVRDGGAYNASQLYYAQSVANSLLAQREDAAAPIGLLEASTGTGKTLGYLIPALLCAQKTGARVIVSTYTKQLQQQLFSDDGRKAAAYVNELTGVSVSVARRFGRSNYLSLGACRAHLEQLADTHKHRDIIEFLQAVLEWSESKGGMLITLNEYLESSGLDESDIPSDLDCSALVVGVMSSAEELAEYERTIKQASNADLLIINHALAAINARSWMHVLEAGARKDVYIFDEADKMEVSARAVINKNISIRQALRTLLTGVTEYGSERDIASAVALMGNVERSLEATGGNQPLLGVGVLNIEGLLTGIEKTVLNAASSVVVDGQDFKVRLQKIDFIDTYNELNYALRLLKMGANSMLVASPVKGYLRLVVGRDNPVRIFSRLWSTYAGQNTEPANSVVGILFTSATLTGRSGNFKEFAGSLGINTAVNVETGLPYHNGVTQFWRSIESMDFGAMRFVLPDQRIPAPVVGGAERDEDDERVFKLSERWLAYVVGMVGAAQKAGGRTLVLTSSYEATRTIARMISDAGVSHIVEQKQGVAICQYLPAFLAHNKSILVSHSAWEGLNLPSAISNIVIPQIPYAPLDEGRGKMQQESLAQRGLSVIKAREVALSSSVDNVVRKLKQGVGRGIRAKTDSVTVWLGDPRFPLPKKYMSSFDSHILSLPKRQRYELMGFVPRRFVENYQVAPLFLEGELYEVQV